PRKEKMTLPKKRGRKPGTTASATAQKSAVAQTAKKTETPDRLKGFKDILPLEAFYWQFIKDKTRKLAEDYGFKWIETPTLEPLNLFKRGLGKYTDIVEKEMFEFVDKGGNSVALRPEMTAGIARAYVSHGMHNMPQPVKVFYEGSMFRYENPQSGRLREHHQAGFEILGSENSAADAQLILIGRNLLNELGISFTLQINSIGCSQCREVFKTALVEYYKTMRKELCEDCKRRLTRNPIRLLDCKEEGCQPVKEGAPQTVDYLDEDCKKHFMQVLEILDELEVSYNLNPFIVRGLDYYTRTVFEFWPAGEGKAQSALFGGGRYDNLIEELGGLPTPAVGFSAGIERLILRIKDEGVVVPVLPRPDIFIAQLGIEAKKKAMSFFEELRKEGFRVVENFAKDSLKQQLEDANKMKVRIALIIGQKELQEGTILLRDMDAGVQEVVDQKKIIPELRAKLKEAEVLGEEEEENS
ncbi:histidine--tRNA ligase, partial [Patescibacteria group bacterium]|nr:histidine--tRNA ligase [Patescibacteria group bacterium]